MQTSSSTEMFMQAAIDALSGQIAVLDARGVIVQTNEAWREFARRSARENEKFLQIGDNYIDRCLAAEIPEAARIADAFREIIDGSRQNLALEYSARANRFRLRVNAFGVGENRRLIVARENIEASEERYRAFIEQSSEAIWRYELKEPVSVHLPPAEQIERFYEYAYLAECNDVMARMYGFSRAEELIGIPLGELLPAGKEENTAYLQAFIESGYRLNDVETEEFDRDGNPKNFLNNLVGILENDLFYRAWGTQRDITEQKRTARILRESEERYRSLFNSIDEGFCVIELIFDAGGEPTDYRFLELNPAFEKASGMRGAAGKRMREIAPDHEQFWFDAYGKVALTGEPIRFEHHAAALGRWFDVYALRIGEPDRGRVAVVINNITERKRIEIERENLLRREQAARREAEEANRAKDDFLSILSHELRTPLNSILGWVRMLRTGMLDQAQSEQALETIERNTRLQNSLIEDLLDVSRIITGKLQVERTELDFVKIVERAVETIRPLAQARNVRFEFRADVETQKVNGDAVRLEQIVNNLANNAVKFTPEGGAVTLRLFNENGAAQLTVSDTGIGIRAELLPLIFDRFQQADSTTKRLYTGLGLGLTIVRHLTALHDGTISAASPGEDLGAVFRLSLPLADADRGDASGKNLAEKVADFSLAGVKILMVDDNEDGQLPLQIFLEQRRAQVETADSVDKALKKLNGGKFDLLVSDIGLPERDGFDLIEQVRRDGNQIPAIALTAYASDDDRRQTLAAGFQFHLSKPIEFDLFLQTVERALHLADNG